MSYETLTAVLRKKMESLNNKVTIITGKFIQKRNQSTFIYMTAICKHDKNNIW